MNPATSFAQLDSLVALITSAVNDAKEEYSRLNLAVPDLASVDAHPMDSMPVPRKLKKAAEIVNGACAQLSTLLLSPYHALYLRCNDYITSISMRVAYEAKVADHLKEHPQGLHVSEIAARNGLEQGKLARLLRVLATKQCFREVKDDVFANNRLSVLLCSGTPSAGIVGLSLTEQFQGGNVLYQTLTDKVTGPSYAPNHSSFSRAHGGHPLWQYYREVNPAYGKRFSAAMKGFGHTLSTETMVHGFPWNNLPPETSVCDLGSGIGYISLDIMRLNPGVRIVLQDLEETIEHAKAFWQDNAHEAVSEGRVRFVPVDFFKEPPVAGCDIYYIKQCIHNWKDEESKVLLANIRKVMKPTSRIILQEYVMPHLSPSSEDSEEAHFIAQAPAPLLPSFGEGRLLQHYLDIAVMILTNSRERTLSEFKQLGNAVGLEIAEVWDCGELSALEYRLPQGST
ncbi:hypothetical protein EIP91_009955 [Steccherinum ochraceum]|uniref:Uncharacterized protein n=1 Tax=Steccherinum ochraceum TaxID=92696 RepID=A0A4R0R927_9APHY|nr:hypothetical protein EIP91_009955 [Steccherinum ochraceum]